MADSDKPNNEALVLKQLKSIKVALWILVTVLVILPVIAAVGTGVVMGIMALGESKLNDGRLLLLQVASSFYHLTGVGRLVRV